MKRRFQGLSDSTHPATDEVPDGIYLVRVERAQYHWHAQKPYYLLHFSILEPSHFAARFITGRIYYSPKALWRLSWFLRDFGYDTELFRHDEIEDRRLVGLLGVMKISHVVRDGISLLNLDTFAPAAQWEEFSSSRKSRSQSSEVA